MDITIQRDALLKPLQAISGIVEKKQTLPILSNILLSASNNELHLIGTDLEIELIGVVPLISLQSEGKTTVSARKLFDICRTLPDASLLHLSLNKHFLTLRTGESCFMLNTLAPEDFPSLDHCDYPRQFTIKQNQFKSLLSKTYFAMSQQDVRHYLNGAFLEINQQTIQCIAADGHRLALSKIEENRLGTMQSRLILPRKSVLELIRLLASDDDSDITVSLSDSRIHILASDYIFTSKLINAQCPDYNKLIPQGTITATGDREAIKQALTRASILSNEKFRGVRFLFDKEKLHISANNSDQEQAEEALPLNYSGDKIEIAFNVTYLQDIFAAISSKIIRIIFSDPNHGVIFEPEDNGSNPLNLSRYIVMPMRL